MRPTLGASGRVGPPSDLVAIALDCRLFIFRLDPVCQDSNPIQTRIQAKIPSSRKEKCSETESWLLSLQESEIMHGNLGRSDGENQQDQQPTMVTERIFAVLNGLDMSEQPRTLTRISLAFS